MRGKLILFTLGLLMIAGYVASPFVAAWSLREAIRTGDAAYLADRVDWPRVRVSLRNSMGDYALGAEAVPAANAIDAAAAATVKPGTVKPGLWQRLKQNYGRRVVASMVERMVTPEGLPKLFAYRKSFNENVRGISDETRRLPVLERINISWSRVTQAEFLTPSHFALEMRDRHDPARSYAGVLELTGGIWRLVHLEVRGTAPSAPLAATWGALRQAALPASAAGGP